MKKTLITLVAVLGASLLTACGGGGGGTSPSLPPIVQPPNPPITLTHPSLQIAVNQGGTAISTSSTGRKVMDVPAPTSTPVLTVGQIPPAIIFNVDDSYVTQYQGASSVATAYVFAYYSNANGSTLPSAYPTLQWTFSNSLFAVKQSNANAFPPNFLPSTTLNPVLTVPSNPSAGPGVETFTATDGSNQNVTGEAATYNRLNLTYDNVAFKYSNYPSCLTFNATGHAVPAQLNCDIAISPTTGITFGGATATIYVDGYGQAFVHPVLGTNPVSIDNIPVGYNNYRHLTDGHELIIFTLKDGRKVKLNPQAATQGSDGNLVFFQAAYRVSDANGNFDF
jgi:hypothetical protein